MLTPVEVALKICEEGQVVSSGCIARMCHHLTLETLQSTARMLASMMVPMSASPMRRDHMEMSMSTLRPRASRLRSEVMRSVPSGLVATSPSSRGVEGP